MALPLFGSAGRALEDVLDHLRRAPGALKASEARLVGTVIMTIEDALGIPGEPAHRQPGRSW